jgi:hypothetical protein
VQIGLGYGGAVDLGLEHSSIHLLSTLG